MRTEFTAKTKLQAFQRANGTCESAGCGAKLTPGKFTYDHRIPDQLGGDNSLENCQVICSVCDKEKTRRDQCDIANRYCAGDARKERGGSRAMSEECDERLGDRGMQAEAAILTPGVGLRNPR